MNCGKPRCAVHADDVGDAEHVLEARESVEVFGTDVHAIASFHQGMDEADALYERIRHVDMKPGMNCQFALTFPRSATAMHIAGRGPR
jgi:hypothetical protein